MKIHTVLTAAAALLALAGCASKSTPPAASSGPGDITITSDQSFPPRTFSALAALGAGTAGMRVLSTSTIGIADCTGHRVVLLVPKTATKKQVVTALAHVYATTLKDDKTGAAFAYHSASETHGAYTAGRLQLDSACSGEHRRQVVIDVGDAIGTSETVATITS